MQKKIYLDNAASTKVDERVLKEMLPYFNKVYGNASSLHQWGQDARAAVDLAREKVAKFLNCSPEEVIFTSGATESDNFAVLGVILASNKEKKHIISSPIEHHAVEETLKFWKEKGLLDSYSLVSVDKYGIVSPKDVEKAITPDTILVSIMYANNEVGTIEPISEISKIAKKYNIIFHTDATQAAGYLDCNIEKLGIDLLSLSGHKIYGPKGVGALYIRKGTCINRIQIGGSHEFEMRAGTENVPGIIGLGKALELVMEGRKERNEKITKLRDKLISGASIKIKNSHLSGHPKKRLPNNANFAFENVEGESIVMSLDLEGIASSTGSACTSKSLKPSHVLLAMGISAELAHGSLRFTLSKDTTERDIDRVLKVLPKIITRLRKMAPTKLNSKH